MTMKRIVVLTGAGISAESGLKTFRDAGGLWEGHDVMEVASPEGFAHNPELVLRFYNERRRQLRQVQPNAAHYALVALEERYEVFIVTQNVDDLHERAGSSNIIHLHGELLKARSVDDESLIVPMLEDIHIGDLGPDGKQLRPQVVWFGEDVPKIVLAAMMFSEADMILVIGTSLVVYPASGLIDYASPDTPVYVVDPNKPRMHRSKNVEFITDTAVQGVPALVARLIEEAENE
ncbi:MAG: NAD-dependent deacylase [Bacteroidetes bacterium]|nr:MAG: NAD-dependent deacylase [Bacteroidota bacterium]